MIRTNLFALILALASVGAMADEPLVKVAGSDSPLPAIRHDFGLLVELRSLARHFGWTAKVVRPNRLVALCRQGDEEVCVPVSIDAASAVTTPHGVFVQPGTVAAILGFRVTTDRGRTHLIPEQEHQPADSQVTPYHAHWGDGRGFQVGQTLPDIPLVDLDGQEVRFSRFLGQQYIIYCWASW